MKLRYELKNQKRMEILKKKNDKDRKQDKEVNKMIQEQIRNQKEMEDKKREEFGKAQELQF